MKHENFLFGKKWLEFFYLFQYKLSSRAYIQSRFAASLIISINFLTFFMDLILDPAQEAQIWLEKTYFYQCIRPFLTFYLRFSSRNKEDPFSRSIIWMAPCVLGLMAIFLLIQFVLFRITVFAKIMSKNKRAVWRRALHYSNYVYICFYWIGNSTLIFNVNNLLIMTVFYEGYTNYRIIMSIIYVLTLLASASFAQLSYLLSSDHIPNPKNYLTYVHYWSPLTFNLLTTAAHLVKELIKHFQVDLLHMFYSFFFYIVLLVLLERYHQFFDRFISLLFRFWISLIFSVNLAFFFFNIKIFIFPQSNWYSHQDPLLITLISLPFFFYSKQRAKAVFDFRMSTVFSYEKLTASEFILYLDNRLKTLENLEGWQESLFWVSVYQYHKSTCEIYREKKVENPILLMNTNPNIKIFREVFPQNAKKDSKKRKTCFCLGERDLIYLKKNGLKITNFISREGFRLLRLVRVLFESGLSERSKKKQLNSLGYLYVCYSSFLYVYFSNATNAFLFLNIAKRYLKKVSFKEQIMMKNLMQLINKNQVRILTDEQQKVAIDLEACIKAETGFHSKFVPKFLKLLDTNIDFWDFVSKNTGTGIANKSIMRPQSIEAFMKLLEKHHLQIAEMKECFNNLMEITPRYSVTLKAYSLFKLFVLNDELDAMKLNKSVFKIINEQARKDFRLNFHKIDRYLAENSAILRVSGLKESFGNVDWVSSRAPNFFGVISKTFLLSQNINILIPQSIRDFHGNFISNYYSGTLSTNGILFHLRRGFVMTLQNELVPVLMYVKPFLQIRGTIQFSSFFGPFPQPPDQQIYYISTSMSGTIDGFSKNLLNLLEMDPNHACLTSIDIEDIIRKIRPYFIKLMNKNENQGQMDPNAKKGIISSFNLKNRGVFWEKDFKQIDFIITENTWMKIYQNKKEIVLEEDDYKSYSFEGQQVLEVLSPTCPRNKKKMSSLLDPGGVPKEVLSPTLFPCLGSMKFEEFQKRIKLGSKNTEEKRLKEVRLKCDVHPKKFVTSNSNYFSVVLELRNVSFASDIEESERSMRRMEAGFEWDLDITQQTIRKKVTRVKKKITEKQGIIKIRRSLITMDKMKKGVKSLKKEINSLISGTKTKGRSISNSAWKYFVIYFALGMVVCSGIYATITYFVAELQITNHDMAMINVRYPFAFIEQFIGAFLPFLQIHFLYKNSANTPFFSTPVSYTTDFILSYLEMMNNQIFLSYVQEDIENLESGQETMSSESFTRISLAYDLVFNVKNHFDEISNPNSESLAVFERKKEEYYENLKKPNHAEEFLEEFKSGLSHQMFLVRLIFGFSLFLIGVMCVISIAIMIFLESRVNNLLSLFLSIPIEKAQKHTMLRYSLKNRITSTLEEFTNEKFDKMFERIELITCGIDSQNLKSSSKSTKMIKIMNFPGKIEETKKSVNRSPLKGREDLATILKGKLAKKKVSKFRWVFNVISYLIKMLSITYLGLICIGYFVALERLETHLKEEIFTDLDMFDQTLDMFVAPYIALNTTFYSINELLCLYFHSLYGQLYAPCANTNEERLIFPMSTPFQSSQFIENLIEELAAAENIDSPLEKDFCDVFAITHFLNEEKAVDLLATCQLIAQRISTKGTGFLVFYQNLALNFQNFLVASYTNSNYFWTTNEKKENSLSFLISFDQETKVSKEENFFVSSFLQSIENLIFVLGVSNFALVDYLFTGKWTKNFQELEVINKAKIGFCACFFVEIFIICIVLLWSTLKTIIRMKSYRSMLRLFPDSMIRKNRKLLFYLGGPKLLKTRSDNIRVY